VFLKNGTSTNLAKTASAKTAATAAASGYPLTDAKDTSNSTYYASSQMDWLQWWVLVKEASPHTVLARAMPRNHACHQAA
jgi:hypothetical protein